MSSRQLRIRWINCDVHSYTCSYQYNYPNYHFHRHRTIRRHLNHLYHHILHIIHCLTILGRIRSIITSCRIYTRIIVITNAITVSIYPRTTTYTTCICRLTRLRRVRIIITGTHI